MCMCALEAKNEHKEVLRLCACVLQRDIKNIWMC